MQDVDIGTLKYPESIGFRSEGFLLFTFVYDKSREVIKFLLQAEVQQQGTLY